MRTWLITGVSSGLGRAVANAALSAGDRVVGTLRSEDQRADFDSLQPGRAYGVLLDVADTAAIEPLIGEIEREIGPVDILLNNAGYGHEGLIEESSLDELRAQFEVNFFGAAAVAKAVLPAMRKRRKGHILNVTSMGGIITMPGLGFYHASKFALEGFSEALAKEVRHLGIHVTAVEPGSFRTDWAGRSMIRAARSISDYDEVMDPLRERRAQMSGRQIGDPERAAAAIVRMTRVENPPMHLLLGSDALQLVDAKIDLLKAEISAWQSLTLSTDFTGS